ncbi:MAG: SDR family oxidoreductase [Chitinophagales bacterium]|nr:SDR family oxidoreductase [Chitinophagales bacterium]
MKSFKNKVVVITGAGSGMGRAYALAFAKEGANLALNSYSLNNLEETKEIVNSKYNVKIYTSDFDVSNNAKMKAFAKNVKKNLGNAHVIINNAGIEGNSKPVFELSVENIDRIMQVNFYGVVNGTLAFLPQLIDNNEGAIVNVSSIFGLVGVPNFADYCASKFAVRGFTESLMVELLKSPITVHLVHPGGINTNITHNSENQKFDSKYLSTPPEAIASVLIKAIKRKQSKIVYGNGALKTWLGANFVPQDILNGILWHEFKKVIDLKSYKKRFYEII